MPFPPPGRLWARFTIYIALALLATLRGFYNPFLPSAPLPPAWRYIALSAGGTLFYIPLYNAIDHLAHGRSTYTDHLNTWRLSASFVWIWLWMLGMIAELARDGLVWALCECGGKGDAAMQIAVIHFVSGLLYVAVWGEFYGGEWEADCRSWKGAWE